MKEQSRGFLVNVKNKVRELADLPENIMIALGAVAAGAGFLLYLAPVAPQFVPIAYELTTIGVTLIGGGYLGKVTTEAVWPKQKVS